MFRRQAHETRPLCIALKEIFMLFSTPCQSILDRSFHELSDASTLATVIRYIYNTDNVPYFFCCVFSKLASMLRFISSFGVSATCLFSAPCSAFSAFRDASNAFAAMVFA
jgi:hypothetical protein